MSYEEMLRKIEEAEVELREKIADEIASRAMENLLHIDNLDADERRKVEALCDGLMLAASIARGKRGGNAAKEKHP